MTKVQMWQPGSKFWKINLNFRRGWAILIKIATEYVEKYDTHFYINNVYAVWSRNNVATMLLLGYEIVLILSLHLISHYAMTQKWFYLSEFLGGAEQTYLRQASFLESLYVGGLHGIEVYILLSISLPTPRRSF